MNSDGEIPRHGPGNLHPPPLGKCQVELYLRIGNNTLLVLQHPHPPPPPPHDVHLAEADTLARWRPAARHVAAPLPAHRQGHRSTSMPRPRTLQSLCARQRSPCSQQSTAHRSCSVGHSLEVYLNQRSFCSSECSSLQPQKTGSSQRYCTSSRSSPASSTISNKPRLPHQPPSSTRVQSRVSIVCCFTDQN